MDTGIWDEGVHTREIWLYTESPMPNLVHNSGFHSMKQLRVFLLRPGWVAGLLYGYP